MHIGSGGHTCFESMRLTLNLRCHFFECVVKPVLVDPGFRSNTVDMLVEHALGAVPYRRAKGNTLHARPSEKEVARLHDPVWIRLAVKIVEHLRSIEVLNADDWKPAYFPVLRSKSVTALEIAYVPDSAWEPILTGIHFFFPRPLPSNSRSTCSSACVAFTTRSKSDSNSRSCVIR